MGGLSLNFQNIFDKKLNLYEDIESSTDVTMSSQISPSIPSPIISKVTNTGSQTINIKAYNIIFYYGQPLAGTIYTITTIPPKSSKYFYYSRYLPSSFVQPFESNIQNPGFGKTSIKKQNLGGGKINLNKK